MCVYERVCVCVCEACGSALRAWESANYVIFEIVQHCMAIEQSIEALMVEGNKNTAYCTYYG